MASEAETYDDGRGQEFGMALVEFMRRFERTVTGFSAGVDSSVVAVAASRALGDDALAVTAATDTIPAGDLELARRIVKKFDLSHLEVSYNELEIDGYAENPVDRCYFCKDALYRRLVTVAEDLGGATILDGTNADDVGDYRPGRLAAEEQNVVSPLLELGYTKRDVRAVARWFELENAERPSGPCLSSRVPYGTKITGEILQRIAAAEGDLRDLGFGELRVRHHGDVARIEIPAEDFGRAVELSATIEQSLKARGYSFVALDLGGFRSGSLNRVLTHIEIPSRA